MAIESGHEGATYEEMARNAGMMANAIVEAIRADRTITTVEQADALPVGSWIRDDCDVTFVRRSSSDIGWFDAQSGLDPLCDLFGARYIAFPARVLYRPDEDGAQ